ncbi:YfcC family protein [Maribellus mangrovi]|uniref:YfcC family protein n=1 Tax=Maribellus mangrovi TaxID=3133146 RepID=UPI0030EB4C67
MSSEKSRRFKIPHVFVLLTVIIFLCSVLSYVVPSGIYQRETINIEGSSRTVVIPGTYSKLNKHISLKGIFFGESNDEGASPVSLIGFLTAIPRGMADVKDVPNIIFMLFIIGGVLGIFQRTGTITAFIQTLFERFSNSGPVLTITLMLAVGIGGSTFGMGEELIPLVPIFLMVSYKLGYDRIYGMSIIYLGALVGFAAATTNPFTVQIAQGIAEVPPGSGILFRVVFFVVIMSVTIGYVLLYGRKIRKDPSKMMIPNDDPSIADIKMEKQPLKISHILILSSSAIVFFYTIYAFQKKGWWLNDMSGAFVLMGIIAILVSGLSLSEAMKAFVKGMEEMVVAALVVGFASGIRVVLEDGQILDTIIHTSSGLMNDTSRIVAVEGMFVFQTILNFFIPSGSGQAAVTMPLMAPLADVLGVSRQTAVFAFTSGDGFSNIIIPTSGILMAMLSMAKIPYEKWLRFIAPLFLILVLIAGIFLGIAVLINY